MDHDRWKRVEALFYEVLDLPPSERTAHLTIVCPDDPELRLEVESLLASIAGAAETMRNAISGVAESFATTGVASLVGKRLGAYRLVDVIGEGGMGAVYLAKRDDEQYERTVAIKILPLGLATQQAIARFRDERQILAGLDHPSIVRLLDGGATEDGVPYLVMEHVDGVPLTVYTSGLPLRAKVALMLRVAAALQYAHQQLIVHRDIKPGNILVDASGTPKLLDFGIAKLLDAEPGARAAKTRTGIALLTLEYASPEQARGEPVTVATDVYSLGAVLYEVLAGKPPLRATGSALEMLRQISEVDPPRPSAVAADRALVGDLDNIAMKALHKRPDRRYTSVAQLADDLDRFLRGLPVSARDATFRYRARKFVGRNRGKLIIAAIVAGALVAATVVSIREARRADEQAAHARTENVALLSERGAEELTSGHPGRALPFLVEALRIDRNSAGLRFSIAEATRTFDNELTRIELGPGVAGVGMSADGARIAFTGLDRVTRVVDARTGDQVAEDHGSWIGAPTFSHDGRHLFAFANDGSISDWTFATNTRRILHGHGPLFSSDVPVQCLAVAPDDTRLVSTGGDGHLIIWDLASGTVLRDVVIPPPRNYDNCTIEVDARRAVVAVPEGPIRVFDIQTGDALASLVGAPEGYHRIRLTRDGRLFIAGDASIEIWDIAKAERIGSIADVAVGAIEVDPEGNRIAARSRAAPRIRIWNAQDGKLVSELPVAGVMQFSRDGKTLVTTGDDSTHRIWDVATGEQQLAMESVVGGGTAGGSLGGSLGAWFSPDGTRLWTVSARDATLWRLDAMLQRPPLRLGWYALGIALSPDEHSIAVVGRDRLEIRDIQTNRLLHATGVAHTRIWDADWNGDRIVTVGDGGFAQVYDREAQLLRVLKGHTGTVNRGTWSPDGSHIVTASDDRTARVWDGATGAILATLQHPDKVMSASWSRDGVRIVTAGWDHKLRIWNPATGAVVLAIDVPRVGLLDAEFSPDGGRIVSTGHGGEIDVWNASTGAHELSLVGHSNPVTTATWSSDGQLIASTSSDWSTRIWDARTGKQLATRKDDGEVMEGLWSRDGTRVFTISVAGTLRMWDIARDTRSVDELDTLMRDRVPYRLDDGHLVLGSFGG